METILRMQKIPWAPGYKITNDGRVWSEKSGRWLKTPPSEGYPRVKLCVDGKEYTLRVHRLVALAFLGPAPDGKPCVLHGDGNQLNNHLWNLRWGSKSENMADCLRHGTHHSRTITHCPQGHAYDNENTRRNDAGHRYCRTCKRDSDARRGARQRQQR
ncbi:HNH endonuclease signature motif containing protein [Streptomyces sp. NBC_00483]|uniref:HNH endonuclease signature motif containing protein n=1 Tax=Streptomyces sp. NBC_00483 TaxID=2975756 RepID=UPI003FCE19C0